MTIGDIGSLKQDYIFDSTRGRYPSLTHILDDQFLVCYEGPTSYGTAKSFNITALGVITEPANNTLTFIEVDTNDHYSLLREPNVVADVYQIADFSANLEAIIVASDGTLSQHANPRGNVVVNIVDTMNPVLRLDSIFAVAYYHSNGWAYIGTSTVASDGEVRATPIESYQMTDFLSPEVSICEHVNNKHVFVCTDGSKNKWAQSVNIDSVGDVSATGQPKVEICSLDAEWCHVIKLKTNWFVCVAYGGGGYGRAIVFKCLSDGTVSIPTNNVHSFDVTTFNWPRAIRLSDDVFAVAYTSESNWGKLKTIKVETGAAATWTNLKDHTFTDKVMHRVKIQLRNHKFAVLASYDELGYGHIRTISLESEPPPYRGHELIMGIGP